MSDLEAEAIATVARGGGRAVKLIGDEVMFVAVDPDDCLAIAAGVIAGLPGMEARCGVAAGEVATRGGDHYGRAVNLAARIVATAVPGEVLTDAAAAERCVRHRLEGAGRRALKGFAEPVAVCSLVVEDETAVRTDDDLSRSG